MATPLLGKESDNLGSVIKPLAWGLGVLWAIEIIDTLLLGSRLQQHGIQPRRLSGLWGVLFSPFLHGGWSHLIANSAPFVVLGSLVRGRGRVPFAEATTVIILVGGLGTWLTGGANSNHIGASGVIFGWFGYLLLAGWYERSLVTIGTSVVVGVLYGGMIWGVLPTRPGVSWQGHLFGFLGGWLAAKLIAWSGKEDKKELAPRSE
ncbi:MAG: rhomboid family intramembrane serine protease [Myxococcales bacterium]|nr:rhomboid family intramembrane serine protease [Myxococcales bacterium]